MTIRAQSEAPTDSDDLEIIEVEPAPIAADPEGPTPPARRTTARGVISLTFAVVGLGFVVWMMFTHPKYPSLFGPPPAPKAVAVAAHIPPPRPIAS